MKNTKWSIDFFNKWFAMRKTKNTFCDQHVLNVLINQLRIEAMDHKIAILPPKALNSVYPAIVNFEDEDSILM